MEGWHKAGQYFRLKVVWFFFFFSFFLSLFFKVFFKLVLLLILNSKLILEISAVTRLL